MVYVLDKLFEIWWNSFREFNQTNEIFDISRKLVNGTYFNETGCCVISYNSLNILFLSTE